MLSLSASVFRSSDSNQSRNHFKSERNRYFNQSSPNVAEIKTSTACWVGHRTSNRKWKTTEDGKPSNNVHNFCTPQANELIATPTDWFRFSFWRLKLFESHPFEWQIRNRFLRLPKSYHRYWLGIFYDSNSLIVRIVYIHLKPKSNFEMINANKWHLAKIRFESIPRIHQSLPLQWLPKMLNIYVSIVPFAALSQLLRFGQTKR